ncbi:MAG: alpha-N-arabinofuranosidase [Clostridiaceae bacterium]|nr:alpha-N-arabinofuranosidase [Clostridiaceae bacterium]
MANRLTIDRTREKAQISRHIYGHFAEHLGRCVYEGIWVGEDSPIPNTRGIRNDVVAALRAIKVPLVRWPGGCFADEYHWMDGIGHRENRKEMINTHWGNLVENNHFGTHEFFDFCEQVGCEPYVAGNLGSGTLQEMSEWVEYMNFDGKSPMTQMRAANGREEPWRLRYFGIGNENWGCGGKMRAEYYADEYMRYATYCRDYPNAKLYRIAAGPRKDNYHWTKVLMENAGMYMDGLALHYYTRLEDTSMVTKLPDGNARYARNPNVKSYSATQFERKEWDIVMRESWFTEELMTRHSAIMDAYDPDKKVALIVDEWGTWFAVEPGTNPGFLYQQNTLRDALVAGMHLNIFNNHADRVRMANIAQMINVLQAIVLTDGEKMVLTPTYHVFDMFKVHQDAMLLDHNLLSDGFEVDGKTIPQVNASVSRNAEGKIHITLCNVNPENGAEVECFLDGIGAGSNLTGTVLTSDRMNAHNDFDRPEDIKPAAFTGYRTENGKLTVEMPSKSVVLLTIG